MTSAATRSTGASGTLPQNTSDGAANAAHECRLECHADVQSLADDWEALADRTNALPWARPGWVASWHRAFGSGPLAIYGLRRGGALSAVLPLQRSRGALLSPTNYHTPEFDAVGDAASVAILLDRMLDAGPRRASLQFVNAEGDGPRAFRQIAARRGYRLIVRTLERSPYISIDRDWEEYQAERDAKFRRELRRRRRRLEEDGALSLHVATGDERLEELLDEGLRVEAAGWKGVRGTAIASNPATRQFYGDVARWAASRGTLRLAFLRHGSRAIAFDFTIEEGGIHYLLKTGYDPGASRFAPGKLLRYAMIERAFRLGFRSYEFLGDDNPWKLEWTDSVRHWSLVQAFSPSIAGWVDWAAFAHGRPLVKRALAVAGR